MAPTYQFPKQSKKSEELRHKKNKKDSDLRTNFWTRALRKKHSTVHKQPTTFSLQEIDCVDSETHT